MSILLSTTTPGKTFCTPAPISSICSFMTPCSIRQTRTSRTAACLPFFAASIRASTSKIQSPFPCFEMSSAIPPMSTSASYQSPARTCLHARARIRCRASYQYSHIHRGCLSRKSLWIDAHGESVSQYESHSTSRLLGIRAPRHGHAHALREERGPVQHRARHSTAPTRDLSNATQR
jgi:hypothetical protein